MNSGQNDQVGDGGGDDLGLGDVNELAAAAGGGEPAIQDSTSEIRDGDVDQGGEPDTTRAEPPVVAQEDPPTNRAGRRKRAAKEAEDLAGLTGEAKAKHDRIVEIRGRLEAIGDPFAERQRLAAVRAGLLEERRKNDEALRLKIAEAETAHAAEQEKAQWVAKEKHDMEKELARLLT